MYSYTHLFIVCDNTKMKLKKTKLQLPPYQYSRNKTNRNNKPSKQYTQQQLDDRRGVTRYRSVVSSEPIKGLCSLLDKET